MVSDDGESVLSEQALEKIETLAEQVVKREGCRLYDIEFGGGNSGRVLRVYIDKDGDNVGIEDCANVSRGLNLLLDVEDPIPGGTYNLEVSSPGLERTLRKPWHFEVAVGKKVWLRISQSLETFGVQNGKYKTAKQFSEVLLACEPEGVRFEIEKESIFVPFSAIEKAKLVFDYAAEKGKKKNNR